MDVIIKNLLLQQIRLKLQLVDGEVKQSKVKKIMKHCVSHISAAINRSASRNIFLNATKMVNLARHTQQNFSSSTSCDLTSSSASASPDDLIQQFELQIMNQNVLQIQVFFLDLENLWAYSKIIYLATSKYFEVEGYIYVYINITQVATALCLLLTNYSS